jgi:acyl carrier protein
VVTSAADREGWDRLVADLSEIAEVPPAAVHQDSQLIEDLALDSFALTELVLTLIDQYGMETLSEDLEGRRWNGVTAGQLYREWRLEVRQRPLDQSP